MKQIKIEKKPIEEQLIVINIRLCDLARQVADLQEIVKAHAGWIDNIETHLRKVENER